MQNRSFASSLLPPSLLCLDTATGLMLDRQSSQLSLWYFEGAQNVEKIVRLLLNVFDSERIRNVRCWLLQNLAVPVAGMNVIFFSSVEIVDQLEFAKVIWLMGNETTTKNHGEKEVLGSVDTPH